MNNCIAIAIAEIKTYIEEAKEKPLVERLKIAMKQAQQHWLVVDENERFQAAIASVFVLATEEEKHQLTKEINVLKGLSAACSGIPVDMNALMSNINPDELIGLKKIWEETKVDK